MKRFLTLFFVFLVMTQQCQAWSWKDLSSDERAIERVLKSQVKYANRTNFKKFISTYDSNYVNSDGFNLEIYSKLIKDIWNTYDDIKYFVEIKKITVNNNKAVVELTEKSFAEINMLKGYNGELNSTAESIYYLQKTDNKWKVISDTVLDETTSMLYGEAKDLEITLSVPNTIESNKEYCATLEFTPPQNTIAIASIASDIVEYPQKPTEEIFRALPEDNILERLFTSNSKNANEYVVASIGLTKTAVDDLTIKLSLTGFGYAIKRVNVIHEISGENNVKD